MLQTVLREPNHAKNERRKSGTFCPWSPHLKLSQEGRVVACDRLACFLPWSAAYFPVPLLLVPTTSTVSGSSSGGGRGGEPGGASTFRDGRAARRRDGRAIVVRVTPYQYQAGGKEESPANRVAKEMGRQTLCEVEISHLTDLIQQMDSS